MKKLTILALLFTVFAANRAFAADVAVYPVEGTNLQPGENDAIGVMIAESYRAESGLSVIGPSQSEKAVSEAESKTAAAEQLGVSEYIVTSAIRLESKLLITSSLYEAGGRRKYRVRATAASLDDMEQVSARISRSLYLRVPFQHSLTLETVTKTENKVPNRTFSEKVFGIKTAVILPLAIDHTFDPMASLGFNGRLEGNTYFLEFGAGVMLPADFDDDDGRISMGGLFAEIGGSYYLGSSSISPYVGGGLSPRILLGSYDGGVNIAPFLQLGLMFMRESSSRLYTEVRVSQNVLPMEAGYDYCRGYDCTEQNEDSGDTVYPTEIGIALGVGW